MTKTHGSFKNTFWINFSLLIPKTKLEKSKILARVWFWCWHKTKPYMWELLRNFSIAKWTEQAVLCQTKRKIKRWYKIIFSCIPHHIVLLHFKGIAWFTSVYVHIKTEQKKLIDLLQPKLAKWLVLSETSSQIWDLCYKVKVNLMIQ